MPSTRVPAPKGKGKGLGKKVGPLPLWGWAVVVGGGLLVGIYLRRRFANASSSAAPAGTTPTSSSPVGADTTGGSVGASVSPVDSGLSTNLENALVNQSNTLVGALGYSLNTVNTELATINGLAASEISAGIQAQQQSFDFANSVFGSALSFLNTHYPSGGGSSSSSSPPAATAPTPKSAPTTVTPHPIISYGTSHILAPTGGSGQTPNTPVYGTGKLSYGGRI